VWDPRNPDDLYFLTTEGGNKTPEPGNPNNANRDGGGVWRLSLEDRAHPELGGTLTLLLDGSEAPYLNKPDNVELDRGGNLLIQEDPGGNLHVARIVA
jgi:secreted PhoX family phosphatase